MRRTDLLRHLRICGCHLMREGAKHSVYLNPVSESMSTVPRHAEINSFLARKICKDLGISAPHRR
ncbi:MAG: type II toxin-antitoxin system HicA family toxin [bacterium]|nr:type II toxin-antitoxin system HicA family toxin [bacterium]